MKTFILTIDYELSFGFDSGSVYECMIKPAGKLLDLLNEYNSSMTIFWDILHYYRLVELENEFPTLKSDRINIENQVGCFVKDGHDVQMHLHPHWLDASYEKNRWKFEYHRFRLQDLSIIEDSCDINTISGCITIAKETIEKFIRKTIPTYKVTTFRAGGYLIQPFGDIRKEFLKNNILIDSSVCPGLSLRNGSSSYNFHGYPESSNYKFENDPSIPNNKGIFTEVPITSIQIPTLRNIYFKYLFLKKYSDLNKNNIGRGASLLAKSNRQIRMKRFLSRLFIPYKVQLTTDSNFKERFEYICEKAPNYSTMIIHPKVLNEHSLELLKKGLKADRFRFISIKEYLSTNDI